MCPPTPPLVHLLTLSTQPSERVVPQCTNRNALGLRRSLESVGARVLEHGLVVCFGARPGPFRQSRIRQRLLSTIDTTEKRQKRNTNKGIRLRVRLSMQHSRQCPGLCPVVMREIFLCRDTIHG